MRNSAAGMIAFMVVIGMMMSLVAAQADFEFAMRFSGTCPQSERRLTKVGQQMINCYTKATSQVMTATIDSTDAIEFSVKTTVVGQVGFLNSTTLVNPDGVTWSEVGLVAFGTHAGTPHQFSYSSTGLVVSISETIFAASGSGILTSGMGAFLGVNGTMSMNCRADQNPASTIACYIVVIANYQ